MDTAPLAPDLGAERPGHVFWFFGLSGSGKTTVALSLREALRQRGLPVLYLDGDLLREGLCRALGFSEEDRRENIRRAAEVAALACTQGFVAVAAFITPREDMREIVRATVPAGALSLIHANASLEVCRQRDVKGLYARAARTGAGDFTGLGQAFDAPASPPELSLDTGERPLADTSADALAFALRRLGKS